MASLDELIQAAKDAKTVLAAAQQQEARETSAHDEARHQRSLANAAYQEAVNRLVDRLMGVTE